MGSFFTPENISYFALIVFVAVIVTWMIWAYFRDLRRARLIQAGPQAKDIQVGDVKLHYEELGEGPVVILLHGIGASLVTWRRLVPLLAKHYRVICVDLPGFGRSSKFPKRDHGLDAQADTLIEFCRLLSIKEASLVGSSMGGAIALWMGLKAHKMFHRIVVLAPAVSPSLMPVELSAFSSLLHPSASILINKYMIKSIMKRVYSKHELITQDHIDLYQRPYIEEPAALQTFVKATQVISDARMPEAFANLKSEVLLLFGAKDKMVPKSVMNTFLKTVPHTRYAEHPEAGHHPHEDEPDWVFEQVHHFLKS